MPEETESTDAETAADGSDMPVKSAATPETKPPETDAEVEKWKALARKNEDKAKANAQAAKELEALKASQMSDTEKAVAEAEDRGRKAALAESGAQLAAAKIEAALTGVVPDPAAVVEDLNLAKYIGDDGSVNAEAVTALREKYAAFAAPTGKPPVPGVPAGARGGEPGVKQLGRADLATMSAAEIVAARKAGALADLQSGKQ